MKIGIPWRTIAALLVMFPLASSASAGDKVLALKPEGTVLKAIERAALDAAISDKLKLYPDLERIAAPGGDVTDLMMELECIDLDADCLGRVGSRSGADRVLLVEVAKKGGKLVATVKWVSAAKKAVTRADEVTAANAPALSTAVALALENELGAPPVKPVDAPPTNVVEQPAKAGTLIVETNRVQAQIFIDTEYAGTGTATIDRPAGSYTLRITHPGDETQVMKVDIESDKTVTRQVTLKYGAGGVGGEKKPPVVDDDDSSWVVWVVIGAVVVAGAATAIALAAGGDSAGPRGNLLLGIDGSGAWRDPATTGGRR